MRNLSPSVEKRGQICIYSYFYINPIYYVNSQMWERDVCICTSCHILNVIVSVVIYMYLYQFSYIYIYIRSQGNLIFATKLKLNRNFC